MGITKKKYLILKEGKLIKSDVPGTLAGHKKLKIFGRLDCLSGMRMKKENRIFFHSMKDAIKQGYRPCKKCKPMNDEDFKLYRKLIPFENLESFYNRDMRRKKINNKNL